MIPKLKRAGVIFVKQGPVVFTKRLGKFLAVHMLGRKYIWLEVSEYDLLAADWTKRRQFSTGKKPLKTLSWVIPPPSVGAGGHTTIFRMIRHLEAEGYECRLYSYDPFLRQSAEELQQILSAGWPPMKARLFTISNGSQIDPGDAIVATSWQTAYPAFANESLVPRYYFVQDFEPFFYETGSKSLLAENTYRFGFKGITAGNWLKKKLSEEYGMECESFQFGSDFSQYRFENKNPRKDILFYARPVTGRRAFEFGVLALELFAKQNPQATIHMIGWDVSNYNLPFAFKNHGILSHDDLNELYNQCAAGLVMSLTNMSLLPLELLSAGCIPVVNEGENNRMVSDNEYIEYVEPSPQKIADALSSFVQDEDLSNYAVKASASVQTLDWSDATKAVEEAFRKSEE